MLTAVVLISSVQTEELKSSAHNPAPAPQPAPPSAPTPAPIDRNGVLILVRSTLLALDQANKTGNYTVLHNLGSPAFQVNTAAQLAEIFANERRQGIDLPGSLCSSRSSRCCRRSRGAA
jgi:hypothetical protein